MFYRHMLPKRMSRLLFFFLVRYKKSNQIISNKFSDLVNRQLGEKGKTQLT